MTKTPEVVFMATFYGGQVLLQSMGFFLFLQYSDKFLRNYTTGITYILHPFLDFRHTDLQFYNYCFETVRKQPPLISDRKEYQKEILPVKTKEEGFQLWQQRERVLVQILDMIIAQVSAQKLS